MLDIHALCNDPDAYKAHLQRRGEDDESYALVDRIVSANEQRKTLTGERDELRGERNTLSKQIGAMYKAGNPGEAEALKARVAAGMERVKELEAELGDVEAELRQMLLAIPNQLDDSVPDGGEENNQVVKTWGEPPTFDFEPVPHVELGEALGILDFDRSTKLAGARFGILMGDAARLDRALVNLYLDRHTSLNGYTELVVPYLVHDHVAEGTSQLPKFAGDMFKIEGQLNGSDAYLIPTAEVPITNLHREEILDAEQLPLQYCGFTPCFRSEAGSAGRDVRGLIRQHQFHKVELVWIVEPDDAQRAHEALVRHAEELLELLELPYRRVLLAAGDTSFGARICYDLEVWMPSQNAYREISSCSLFGDFQSRRMNMRYRPERVDGKKQKPRYPYTLNGSGLPTGRVMVALLENGQQADGSVRLPEVLAPYFGGDPVLRPR